MLPHATTIRGMSVREAVTVFPKILAIYGQAGLGHEYTNLDADERPYHVFREGELLNENGKCVVVPTFGALLAYWQWVLEQLSAREELQGVMIVMFIPGQQEPVQAAMNGTVL